MSRPYSPFNKDGLHGHNALSWALEWLANKFFLATIPIRPTTATIISKATTDGEWTLVTSGLTEVLEWRLSELNGNDFDYAYVAVPGDNFSVAFGWVSWKTEITAIYVKRKGTSNITVKLEHWKA